MNRTLHVRSGPWDHPAIEDFLHESTIPLRLASAGSNAPLVQSLWFLYEDSALWCCTRADAVVTRRLLRDPHCGFEVCADTAPYRGVRGHGAADIVPDRAADVLPRLIDRYLGSTESDLAKWLLSRLDEEVAIRIGDLSVTSFDFTRRMGG